MHGLLFRRLHSTIPSIPFQYFQNDLLPMLDLPGYVWQKSLRGFVLFPLERWDNRWPEQKYLHETMFYEVFSFPPNRWKPIFY